MISTRAVAGTIAAATALALTGLPVEIARADTVTDCAGLPAAVALGGTVTLKGICDRTGQPSILITGSVTIQGDPSDGPDGLTNGTTAPLFTVGGISTFVTFSQLSMTNSSGGGPIGGSAVQASGCVDLRFDHDTFTGNSAATTGAHGGAIAYTSTCDGLRISDSTFSGNSAQADGGAVFLDSDSQSFLTNVTFTGNTAGGDGGGMAIKPVTGTVANRVAGGVVLSASNTAFTNNLAGIHTTGFSKSVYGGGLAVEMSSSSSGTDVSISGSSFVGNALRQDDDVVANSVGTQAGGGFAVVRPNGAGMGRPVVLLSGSVVSGNTINHYGAKGGGAYVKGWDLDSVGDTWTNNSSLGQSTGGDGSGGGALRIEGNNISGSTTAQAELFDDVVADNHVSSHATGAAIHASQAGSTSDIATLILRNSTVTGNLGNDQGPSAVFMQNGGQILNSIVYGNVSGSGYDEASKSTGTLTWDHSIGCPFTPVTGADCEDPKLADPSHGDVHETAASTATIDKGSAALAVSSFGSALDFEGDARTIGTAPDIGADERGDTDLSVTATGPATATTGTVTAPFTLTVTNAGPSGAGAVALALATTGGTLTAAASDHGTCTAGVCTIGPLKSGEHATVVATATYTAAGAQNLTATLTSANTDSVPANNVVVKAVTVTAPAASPSPSGSPKPSPSASPKPVTLPKLKGSDVLSLPSRRSCASTAKFLVVLKTPKGTTLSKVGVRIDTLTTVGKKTKTAKGRTTTYTGSKLAKKKLTLVKLPTKKISVVVAVTLTDKRTVTVTKLYNHC